MSIRYEDLEDSQRLLNALHLEGRLGPNVELFLEAIQRQLDIFILSVADVVNGSMKVSGALGTDLDKISRFFDVFRLSGETDIEFRSRVSDTVTLQERVTRDSVEEFFERITGKRPHIREEFESRVYRTGDVVDPNPAGFFDITFDLIRDVVHEKVPLQSDRNSVVLSHTNLVSETTTGVSSTTSVEAGDTTIYAQSVSGFPSEGVIKIEDEWIEFSGTTTTPVHAFTGCTRGVWQTEPTAHPFDFPIAEAPIHAWITGQSDMVYDYRSDNTVYLTGGPYPSNTWVDVRYKITDLDSDYDTADEVIAVIDQFIEIGLDYKAAGIKVEIGAGIVDRSWFQMSQEMLIIVEDFAWFSDSEGLAYFIENFTPPAMYGVPVFYTGNDWDVALWDGFHWELDGMPSVGYFLEIQFSL